SGTDHVWRMSGTLMRGMEFDRKWGRAHKVKDKACNGRNPPNAWRSVGMAGTQTARQWRHEERVFATWRVL
ncbi:MAG: hypothetical protein ACREXY_27000, partial [Gammaproteobacteria bacterium]